MKSTFKRQARNCSQNVLFNLHVKKSQLNEEQSMHLKPSIHSYKNENDLESN